MAVVPFQVGSPITVAGPTGSGKTFFVNKLLSTANMFTEPINKILYCYGVYQDDYNKMSNGIEFHEGVPNLEVIQSFKDDKFNVIVLDDLMEEIVKNTDMQNLFTKHCHHYKITAIFITQNIFAQGRCARSINLNSHILVLFANKRDESQADILGKQLFPRRPDIFREAYTDATATQYGYLIVDCAPETPVEFKLRSKIFPGEDTICYLVK